jgi:hypothetical protein
MQLSNDQFHNIISCLRSDNRGGRTVEKRQTPRVGMRARGVIKISNGKSEKPQTVQVRDLSKTGIGFLHNAPIAEETIVTLVLPGEKQKGHGDPMYRVMQCRSVGDGFYAVGAKLYKA